MPVDRAWLERNLGGPLPAPAVPAGQAAERPAIALSPQELARQRIDFDSQAQEVLARHAGWPEAPPTLRAYVPVQWPSGLEPQPATQAPEGESLPEADVLIVTWTTEEGRALAHVLTPGCESHPPTKSSPAEPGMRYWKEYKKNYAALTAHMSPGAPARGLGRLGTYWTATIAGKQVTLFKSDSHMSQDGPEDLQRTPNRLVWKQIIEDCKPKWVITTGTAGGIGTSCEVGDVVATRFVAFDSGHPPKHPAAFEPFACPVDASTQHFGAAHALFAANGQFLPKSNKREPKILHGKTQHSGVITTRGFQYDDSANSFELQGHGDVCEMGDAVLAYVCKELGAQAPKYAMVRNVSDPQIDSTEPEAPALANYIYEHFGRWSTVCSAIVCWAIVAGL
jgi:hypothetical protein